VRLSLYVLGMLFVMAVIGAGQSAKLSLVRAIRQQLWWLELRVQYISTMYGRREWDRRFLSA
jgi:hypothetical protein